MKKLLITLNLFILIILIITTSIYSQNKSGVIIGDSVRIRFSPDVKSRVIGSLNKDDSIEIIEITTEYILADMYYGRWVKLKTKAGIIGFTLSCFIKDLEKYPFHLFFNKFITSIKNSVHIIDDAYLKSIINYPFKYTVHGFDGMTIYELKNNTLELPLSLFIGDGPEEPIVFTLDNDYVKVYKNYQSGCSNTWYFKFVNDSWKLSKGEYTTY